MRFLERPFCTYLFDLLGDLGGERLGVGKLVFPRGSLLDAGPHEDFVPVRGGDRDLEGSPLGLSLDFVQGDGDVVVVAPLHGREHGGGLVRSLPEHVSGGAVHDGYFDDLLLVHRVCLGPLGFALVLGRRRSRLLGLLLDLSRRPLPL